jgi:hypothetical protein
LVKEYFESQQRFVAATKNKDDNYSNGTSNKNSAHKENKNVTRLRITIIGVLIMTRTITIDMNKNAQIPYQILIIQILIDIGGSWMFHLV